MSYTVPALADKIASNLAALESKLGQTSPLNDKSFLRVLAALQAAESVGLYKYAAERALQNLALTATGDDLDLIRPDVARTAAVVAILTATLTATTGTVIPAGTEFTGDSNGVTYVTRTSHTAVAGVATLTLEAAETGSDGNLTTGDTLTLSSAPVAGAAQSATYAATTQTGADRETDEDYRLRVISAQRAQTGGGNATDYRAWGEEVAGVRRVYPYSGRVSGTSYPGDRTLYIETETTVDADGIASAGICDQVAASVESDPVTHRSRPPLGLEPSTLFCVSISRTAVNVAVTGLSISATLESACKSDISAALGSYFRALRPFCAGVDLIQDRNDTVTVVSISAIIQDVLDSYGATCTGITFDTGGSALSSKTLGRGECAKLGTVTYA